MASDFAPDKFKIGDRIEYKDDSGTVTDIEPNPEDRECRYCQHLVDLGGSGYQSFGYQCEFHGKHLPGYPLSPEHRDLCSEYKDMRPSLLSVRFDDNSFNTIELPNESLTLLQKAGPDRFLEGYRKWDIALDSSGEPHLIPLAWSYHMVAQPWEPGINTSTMRKGSWSPDFPEFPGKRGFYSVRHPHWLEFRLMPNDKLLKGEISGTILPSGTVVEGERGFQSEEARIKEFLDDNNFPILYVRSRPFGATGIERPIINLWPDLASFSPAAFDPEHLRENIKFSIPDCSKVSAAEVKRKLVNRYNVPMIAVARKAREIK